MKDLVGSIYDNFCLLMSIFTYCSVTAEIFRTINCLRKPPGYIDFRKHDFYSSDVFPVLNYLSTTPRIRSREWRRASTFLYLDTRQTWVVNFIPPPLYTRYPFYRLLGGPQTRSWSCGEEKYLSSLTGIESRPSSSTDSYTWYQTPWKYHKVRTCWIEYLYLRKVMQEEVGENYITRNFITCTLHQILLWQFNQNNQIEGTCPIHEGDEKFLQNFSLEI
jgi:hypothetical protein